MSLSKNCLLKIVILGDGDVGKSSLMSRYIFNKFDSVSYHTIGVDFFNREFFLDEDWYTLQIWDTAGQERFRSLRTPFYRGSDICLLTFSVDDRKSFDNLTNWLREFTHYADVKKDESFPFVVIGNKVDIPNREVSEEEAQVWCIKNGCLPYVETSAKEGINVDFAFQIAVQMWLGKRTADSVIFQPQILNGDSLKSGTFNKCC